MKLIGGPICRPVEEGGIAVGRPAAFTVCAGPGELAGRPLVEAVLGLGVGALTGSISVIDSAAKTQLVSLHSEFIFLSPKSRSITEKQLKNTVLGRKKRPYPCKTLLLPLISIDQ